MPRYEIVAVQLVESYNGEQEVTATLRIAVDGEMKQDSAVANGRIGALARVLSRCTGVEIRVSAVNSRQDGATMSVAVGSWLASVPLSAQPSAQEIVRSLIYALHLREGLLRPLDRSASSIAVKSAFLFRVDDGSWVATVTCESKRVVSGQPVADANGALMNAVCSLFILNGRGIDEGKANAICASLIEGGKVVVSTATMPYVGNGVGDQGRDRAPETAGVSP